MPVDKDVKKAEEVKYKAGWGMWFHNETGERIVVDCQLYPKVVLRVDDKAITKEELERHYHRLRV